METIEEASIERANKFAEVIVKDTEIPCMIEDLNLWAKEDFKAGVEFAQKWNLITELPPIEEENDMMKISPVLLIKEIKDFGMVRTGYYLFDKKKWFMIPENHEVFPDFWREMDIE